MPLYEYQCLDCIRVTTILARPTIDHITPKCDHCNGSRLSKIISKFAIRRVTGISLDWAPDSEAFGDVDTEDTQDVSRWLRRMHTEMGSESSTEFKEIVSELDREQSHPSKDCSNELDTHGS